MTSKTLPTVASTKPGISQAQGITLFLLFWALAFGILVRLLPVVSAPFPLNDGGLFYRMAADIVQAGYRLPDVTSYNHAGIPFAYPPLGLYLLAALGQVFPSLALVQWLPVVYSVLAIPAFFLLAKTVLQDPVKAGLAAVAFSLIPSSTDILLWGGGVTRGLGFLFCLLAARQIIVLFQGRQWKSVLPAGLLAALVVLSHPSAAFVTVLFAGVFWVIFGRSRKTALQAAAVAGIVLVLTLPWWLTVVQTHGLEAFRAGFGSGWFTYVFVPFITLATSREPLMTVVMVVAIIGLLDALHRRQFLLPLWFFASLLSQRDGYVYASIPVSLLFSEAVIDLLVPAFQRRAQRDGESVHNLFSGGARWFLSFFLIYALINAMTAAEKIRPIRVTLAEQQAIEWVIANTPDETRFLLLTFGDPLNTPFQEWFPALSGRANLTAVQGYEWLPDSTFTQRKEDFAALQACLTEDLACVQAWAAQRQLEFDYLLVHHTYVGALELSEGDARLNQWISAELKETPGFTRVFQSAWIEIFRRTPAP